MLIDGLGFRTHSFNPNKQRRDIFLREESLPSKTYQEEADEITTSIHQRWTGHLGFLRSRPASGFLRKPILSWRACGRPSSHGWSQVKGEYRKQDIGCRSLRISRLFRGSTESSSLGSTVFRPRRDFWDFATTICCISKGDRPDSHV